MGNRVPFQKDLEVSEKRVTEHHNQQEIPTRRTHPWGCLTPGQGRRIKVNQIPASITALGAFSPGQKSHMGKEAGGRFLVRFQSQHSYSFCCRNSLLLGAINPGHGDVLQDDHDGERQRGRVIVKHGDKVVPRTLHEDQPHHKGEDAATDCGEQMDMVSRVL